MTVAPIPAPAPRSGGAFILPQPWHHVSMRALAVTSNVDIYRTANVLVKRHGQDAPIEAAMRADVMLDKGDLEGYAAWKRILRAVEELRARPCKMAVAAGCFLIRQTGGRAGRMARRIQPRGRLARAVPHGSPGAQEGPCAGQDARH